MSGPGAPPYQGEQVDRLLPDDRRMKLSILDSAGLRRALSAEIEYLERASAGRPASKPGKGPFESGRTAATARQALETTWRKFNETDLIEIGIGCESCHLGSREHARDPRIKPSLEPRSPLLRIAMPERNGGHPEAVTRACARCHQVLFTGYPWTWEGAPRNAPVPGGSHINSGEARDMLMGKCRIACTACHDPHASEDGAAMRRLESPGGNAVCTACHGAFADAAALRSHAHHAPDGPGGLCINCHMPAKNMSLDTRLGRYHRIGSPTERAKVEGDRPMECALCHARTPVGEILDTLERWWGRSYDREKVAALYGGLEQGTVEATLRTGKPHEKAVALYLAGEAAKGGSATAKDGSEDGWSGSGAGRWGNSKDTSAPGAAARGWAPLAAAELTDPYPLVRYYAEGALEKMLPGPSPIDLHQDDESIRLAAASWLRAAGYETGKLPKPAPGPVPRK
jgi:predicted CXXCH cytochrome family protein